jgi:hypothetical protein
MRRDNADNPSCTWLSAETDRLDVCVRLPVVRHEAEPKRAVVGLALVGVLSREEHPRTAVPAADMYRARSSQPADDTDAHIRVRLRRSADCRERDRLGRPGRPATRSSKESCARWKLRREGSRRAKAAAEAKAEAEQASKKPADELNVDTVFAKLKQIGKQDDKDE